jgi:hypothetical protein
MERLTLARRAAALAGALCLAACGSRDERVDAAGPYASEVSDALPKIEAAIGVPFKTPPKVETRTREEVRAFLVRRFEEDLPEAKLRGLERTYRRLGLLPDTLDLGKFMLDLLTEQVAGYYDPQTKVLYVVDGSAPEMVNITIAHELVHALQDQYVSLDSIQGLDDDNDRQVAAQSLIEGQATFEQLQSMLGGKNMAAALPGGWERVRDLIRDAQSSMPVFSTAPMVLQETLLFPYLSGAEFMRRYKERNPTRPPFDAIPASTEQLIHDAAFFDGPDLPTRVTLPPLTGGTAVYENNLGEFETRLFLFQHLQDQNAAIRAAAGWDGDRYVLFDTPSGEGLAWVTVWDSAVDAGEFHDVMDTALLKRFRDAKPGVASMQRRSYTSGDRTLVLQTSLVGGRPAVLWLDLPAGASPEVLDLERVTLQER